MILLARRLSHRSAHHCCTVPLTYVTVCLQNRVQQRVALIPPTDESYYDSQQVLRHLLLLRA